MKVVFFLLGWLFTFPSFSSEKEGGYIYDLKIISRFKITQVNPYKDHYILPMKYRMMMRKVNNINNNFCVIGYQFSDKHREGVVFWQEGEELITWQLEGRELDNILIDADSMLDSPSISYKNIVPLAEITTQMAWYAKEDVDPMRADCLRNGETIVIKAFPIPKACRDDPDFGEDCLEALKSIK